MASINDLTFSAMQAIAKEKTSAKSASCRFNDIVVQACEAAWTQVDAACVVDVDATDFIKGTKCASFQVAPECVQGIQARAVTATDGIDFSGYTHLMFYIKSVDAASAAGVLKIGFSDAADASGTEVYLSIPALPVADTWYRVILELSEALLALTSVSSAHLWLETASWAGTILLDDIRVGCYEMRGSEVITLPAIGTDTPATTGTDEIFVMPFACNSISIHELPVDAEVTYYKGTAGTYSTSDTNGGSDYLFEGQSATDLARNFTAVKLRLASDLASGEHVSLLVKEA